MSERRQVLARAFPSLEDVLWEWIAIQERCFRLWQNEPDAIWWNGERSEMGGFAGAIWRVGGVVLEEFQTTRQPREQAQNIRNTDRGRCDMYFELGGNRFVVEAKKCWPWLSDKSLGNIRKELRSAETQVRAVNDRGYERLAIVFAGPKTKVAVARTLRKRLTSEIPGWVQRAVREFNDCACAWVFPESGDKIVWDKKGWCYPGAAVFVKAAVDHSLQVAKSPQ